jgi:hypothetical protein
MRYLIFAAALLAAIVFGEHALADDSGQILTIDHYVRVRSTDADLRA